MLERSERLFGVVKDHAERVTMTGAQAAHAVTQIDSIPAAGAVNRSLADRENDRISLIERHDLDA
jgi:hypothetical protein